jgi:hypothetical protein
MCPLTSIWTHVHPSPSHHQEGGETTLTLEQLAGSQQVAAELQAFEESAAHTPGRLNGWRFDREEANQRA